MSSADTSKDLARQAEAAPAVRVMWRSDADEGWTPLHGFDHLLQLCLELDHHVYVTLRWEDDLDGAPRRPWAQSLGTATAQIVDVEHRVAGVAGTVTRGSGAAQPVVIGVGRFGEWACVREGQLFDAGEAAAIMWGWVQGGVLDDAYTTVDIPDVCGVDRHWR